MTQQKEVDRLRELYNCDLLDTAPEEAFDRVTRVAQKVLNVPIALVSLVDRDRQWFKSRQGIDLTETPRDISFCTHAIRKAQPLIVHDARLDARFRNSPLVSGEHAIRFYAGVPLTTASGNNLGTLCVMDQRPQHLSLKQIDILRDLARIVVDEIELRSISLTDTLTGLPLRPHFLQRAEEQMSHAIQSGENFCIIAMDIDHLTDVNEDLGHGVGDRVLRTVVEIATSTLRPQDLIARGVADEFLVLLPNTEPHTAIAIAEKIRSEVHQTRFMDSGNEVRFTISVGVTDWTSTKADTINRMLNRVDDLLFKAKANGSNCTMPSAA